jgi:hypothetical protein
VVATLALRSSRLGQLGTGVNMKTRSVAVLCAAGLLVGGAGTASAKGGNSDAAKRCQGNGFTNVLREDLSSFDTVGACVSYAARGGRLTDPPPPPAEENEEEQNEEGEYQPPPQEEAPHEEEG